MGGEDLHPLAPQGIDGLGNGLVAVEPDPVVAALGCIVIHAHLFGPDGVDVMDAYRVTGADHGRQVVGLVDLLQADGEIGLAHGQQALDAGEAFLIH